MKLKDIKVGEEYAVAAANADIRFGGVTRAKVVRVGVCGVIRGGVFGRMSAKPNFVEFEMPLGLTSRYLCRVTGNPDAEPGSGNLEKGCHAYSEEGRKCFRAPANHFRWTWAEQEAREAEAQAHERTREAKRKQRDARAKAVASRLQEYGVTPRNGYLGEFTITIDEAEKCVEAFEALAEVKS